MYNINQVLVQYNMNDILLHCFRFQADYLYGYWVVIQLTYPNLKIERPGRGLPSYWQRNPPYELLGFVSGEICETSPQEIPHTCQAVGAPVRQKHGE